MERGSVLEAGRCADFGVANNWREKFRSVKTWQNKVKTRCIVQHMAHSAPQGEEKMLISTEYLQKANLTSLTWCLVKNEEVIVLLIRVLANGFMLIFCHLNQLSFIVYCFCILGCFLSFLYYFHLGDGSYCFVFLLPVVQVKTGSWRILNPALILS